MKVFLICCILIISIIYLNLIRSNSHNFWDHQPVMRNYDNKNTYIIGMIPNFNIDFGNYSIKVEHNRDMLEIYSFLNNNFSNTFNIDYNYFKHNYYKHNSKNIVLTLNGEIISYINSIPIIVYNKPYRLKFNFVDYLCVKKNLRKKNLASLIISSFLSTFNNKNEYFLFKIEKVPLPFCHILKTAYYLKKIDMLHKYSNRLANEVIDICELSNNNIDRIYKIYKNSISQYNFFSIFEKKEFIDTFIKYKSLKLIIINHYNPLLIVGKPNYYKLENVTYKSFDVDVILGNKSICLKKIDYYINYYMIKNKYQYLCIPNIADNLKYINLLNMSKGMDLYYYTYNLNQKKFTVKDFCLNIN